MKQTNSKIEVMEENDFNFFAHSNVKSPLIAIAQQKRYLILSPAEIMYCVAEGSYSHVCLKTGEIKLVSIKLKLVSALLQKWPEFVRIHHSYMINVNFLKYIETSDGWQACMNNNQLLPISNSRKPELMAVFHFQRDYKTVTKKNQ
jgi:two-component system LytT family response regulator